MRARFERDVLSHNPEVVSISVGVNDVWHGFYDFEQNKELKSFDPRFGEDLREFREDLEWMATELSQRNVLTVFVSPTMIGEQEANRENALLAEYIVVMRKVAEEHEALYCPMNERMWEQLMCIRPANPDFALTTDGVHMTTIGAGIMAFNLLTTLGFKGEDFNHPK
jgi:acyl-CoA thioesterase-1